MPRKYAIEGDLQLVIVDEQGEPVKPIRFYPSWKEAQAAIKRLEETMECPACRGAGNYGGVECEECWGKGRVTL